MRDAFIKTTTALLDERDDIAVILADISVGGFVESGATQRHPLRVFNVGIREQLMVSAAGGLALEGFRPIAHSYAPFLIERAFEQIKLSFSHQGTSGILVSIGGSYDDGSGRTHEAPEDVRLISSLPNWTIFQPGHPDEVGVLLRNAAAIDSNVYLRLELTSNLTPIANPTGLTEIKPGPPGSPVVLAIGPMLDRVVTATQGLGIRVFYTAAPFSIGEEVAALTGEEFIVVESTLAGTSLAYIAAALNGRLTRTLGIGVNQPGSGGYGSLDERHAKHRLDPDGIRFQITEWLR